MKLVIEIDLPEAREVLKSGCSVPIASKGVTWSASCLGEMAKKKGVYVIHHVGEILYVGKTEGPTMDFGTRLRREFTFMLVLKSIFISLGSTTFSLRLKSSR